MKSSLLKKWSVGLGALFCLTACGLETINGHQEQEDKKVLQRQVYSLQTVNAEAKQRFEEIDDDIRKLNDRIDVLENKQEQTSSKQDKSGSARELKIKDIEERIKAYKDEIAKLDDQVAGLTQNVTALQDAQKQAAEAAAAEAAPTKSTNSKALYEAAGALFDKKKWKEAALEYEHYRKAAPKGKNVAEATYRMGVCFQEMDSADDAKAFYQEVIERFPKTAAAQHSAYRLKVLSKKK